MKVLIILILIFLPSSLLAQGGVAVPFVRINPSPQLNAMAGAFSGLPTSNPFGMFFNPAQLGQFARTYNFSTSFYIRKADWLPHFDFSDRYFKSKAMNFGYSTNKLIPNLPLHIGIGFIDSKVGLGKNIWTDETGKELGVFESWEKYQQFGLGIGIDWKVKFNFGFAFKNITSNLAPVSVGFEKRPGESKATVYDYGFLMTVPLPDFFTPPQIKQLFVFEDLQTSVDLSAGFALQNVGDSIRYIDSRKQSPFPRLATLGYGLSANITGHIHGVKLQLLKADWSSQAQDILVAHHPDGSWDYEGFPGRINLFDHLISGKFNDDVVIFQGYRIKVFESFEYSYGYFRGQGWDPYIKTSGFMISSQGLGKALQNTIQNDLLKEIVSKIIIQYATSKYSSTDRSHPLYGTRFDGLIISFKELF